MPIRLSIFVVASLMLLSPATAEGELSRPLAAFAFAIDGTAIVSWVPSIDTPDSYKIYGVQGTSMSLLSTVPSDAVTKQVAGGFASYAVTGVKDGVESEPMATASASDSCILITTDPPDIGIGDCGLGGGDGGGGGGGGSRGISRSTRNPPAVLM